MQRVLVVITGDVDASSLRSRCLAIPSDRAVALCYQLPDSAGLEQGLLIQRNLTRLLRVMFGPAAEAIPIFVSADRDGERADDLADAWGATEVYR